MMRERKKWTAKLGKSYIAEINLPFQQAGRITRWWKSISPPERKYWLAMLGSWICIFCGYWVHHVVYGQYPHGWTNRLVDGLLAAIILGTPMTIALVAIPSRILLNICVPSRRRPQLLETLTCIITLLAIWWVIAVFRKIEQEDRAKIQQFEVWRMSPSGVLDACILLASSPTNRRFR